MSKLKLSRLIGRLSCAAAFLTCISAPALRADAIYLVTVDTSAVNGVAGNLDLQLNPFDATSQSATATISSYVSTGGSLDGVPSTTGDVSGALPGPVVISNTTAFNDYFQPLTFGTSLQFILTLTGAALNAPDNIADGGSTFGISLLDSTGDNFLLTNDPSGNTGQAIVNLDGTVSTASFATDTGGTPVTTFTTLITPEPATLGLMGVSLLTLVFARRRLRF